MKKPQWITLIAGVLLTAGIFIFGRTVPKKGAAGSAAQQAAMADESVIQPFSFDSLLNLAKKQLTPQQVTRLNMLENSVTRGDVKDQQIHVYHQLARFWADSARIFEPYALYTGEAARLENSEKSLTFAAQLFLDNLQNDNDLPLRQWKALQAKDLFERSLKINPDNDSARTGLGACYIFGEISRSPMVGISQIRQVVEKDSTNIYAQMMMVRGALMSGQYQKAVPRLETVIRLQPDNADAHLMLAEVFERTGEKAKAIAMYEKSLQLVKAPQVKTAISERIASLRK